MVKGWLSIFVVGMLLAGPAYAADKAPAKEQKGETDLTLTSQKDKVSYIIGLDVGSRLKSQSIDVDQSIFARGLKDGIAGNKPFLSEEEIRSTMTSFNEELKKKHDEEVKKTAEKNKEEGEKFLAENKKKKGVVTLPDGLQYKIIKEGDGPKPKETDTVTVNYVGKLVNGTEFDSSVKRGQPATFPVNGVIAGWKEALPMMKVGSKWELYIPANLAYGDKGAGAVIGPDSTLIFEVELLSIKEPGKTPEKPQGHPQDMHH